MRPFLFVLVLLLCGVTQAQPPKPPAPAPVPEPVLLTTPVIAEFTAAWHHANTYAVSGTIWYQGLDPLAVEIFFDGFSYWPYIWLDGDRWRFTVYIDCTDRYGSCRAQAITLGDPQERSGYAWEWIN